MRVIKLKEKVNLDTPYTLKFDDFIVAPIYDCSHTDNSRKWPRITPLTKNAERGILDLCSYENNYDLQDMFSRFERALRDLDGVEDIDFETRLDDDQICYDLRLSIWPRDFMTADRSALSGKKLLVLKKELVRLFTKYFPFTMLDSDISDFMFEDLSGLIVSEVEEAATGFDKKLIEYLQVLARRTKANKKVVFFDGGTYDLEKKGLSGSAASIGYEHSASGAPSAKMNSLIRDLAYSWKNDISKWAEENGYAPEVYINDFISSMDSLRVYVLSKKNENKVTESYGDEVYQTYCIKNFELNGKSYLNDTIGEVIRYGFVADMKKAGLYLDSEN